MTASRFSAQVGEAGDLTHHVAVGGESHRIDAVACERALDPEPAVDNELLKPLLKALVTGVDVDLLTRLRVFQHKRTDVWHDLFARIAEPDREHLVALRQPAERRLPVRIRR